jgi:hypothetical protein
MTKSLPTGEEIRLAAHERVKAAVGKQVRATPPAKTVAAKKAAAKKKAAARRPRASA